MIDLSKKERKYLYKIVSSKKIINFDKNNKYQEVLIDRGFVKTEFYKDDSDPEHKNLLRPRLVSTTEGTRYKTRYRETLRKELFKNILWPVIASITVSLIISVAKWLLKQPPKH